MNDKVVNDVFSVYEIIKDSIKVTRRTINNELYRLHNRTLFLGEQREKMLTKMDDVEKELDDIMILSLFASFERELRISIQALIDNNTNKVNKTFENIVSLTKDSIERWTVIDMIESLKDVVDDDLRSVVKQIYEYRNWVAHGKNKDKLPSIRTDPKTVQVKLCDFINKAKEAL